MKQLFPISLIVASAGMLSAQPQPLALKINLPKDSPVAVLSLNPESPAPTMRGGMYVMDVKASISLRNSSQRRIRGITLGVYTPSVSGKGAISKSSLDVAPGDTFALRIESHLVQPVAVNPTVEVRLDGVLFDDLGFYGSDPQLQRRMTNWELEAQRDREYFKKLLASAGPDGLRKEMLASLARQGDRSNVGVQVGRATTQESERDVQFAFLDFPGAPVIATAGTAKVGEREARVPQVVFHNRSNREVEHVDISWILRDQQGREFLATMPSDVRLAPSHGGEVRPENALRFDQSMRISSMTGYLSGVEFSNGDHWLPSREALSSDRLRGVAPISGEEARLLQIYKRNGLDALIDELKKF